MQAKLSAYVSPMGAFALSLGATIGWGSLVVTSSSYLSQAGPLGSVLGLVVGMLLMVVVARNYHYLMQRYPDAGGVYSYTKNVFGYDRAFLVAWFLFLTYISIFWANATSVPLFVRYFFGDVFEFGYLYSLFGYDVYLGEVLLTIAATVLIGLLVANSKRVVINAMVVMAFVIIVGIAVCFGGAMMGLDLGASAFNPQFVPDSNAIAQVVYIACISPWAFIGFESISHSGEEFTFSRNKAFRIMVITVVVATLLYMAVTLLSVTAYPPQYDSWLEYISNRGSLQGIEALPAFYAARHYLGSAGLVLLGVALLALVLTSLIADLIALSRLLYSLGKDEVLPPKAAKLNARGIPYVAVSAVVGVSVIIPLLGRTTVGWIVDVTTIGAAIIYCFVSAGAWKMARSKGDRIETYTGMLGLVAMALLEVLVLLIIPGIVGVDAMETESYMLFTVWAVLGFVVFRFVMHRDTRDRFGKSLVVWVALLMLVMVTSMLWMDEQDRRATEVTAQHVETYVANLSGVSDGGVEGDVYVANELHALRTTKTMSMIIVLGLLGVSLVMLIKQLHLYAQTV